MKVNAAVVRQMREQRAWSQEHLTEVSGLSLRTIQRVEADGNASHETRLALAAAFDCSLADLEVPSPAIAASDAPASNPIIVPERDSGSRRLLIWLSLVAAILLFLDWHQNGFIRWAQWPLLGLGIGWIQVALKPRVSPRFRFFGHGLIYLLVCGALALVDIRKSGQLTWSQWPMLGWGLGLCLHGLSWLRPNPRKSMA